MLQDDNTWERRVAELWASIDSYDADDFIAAMERLTSELPGDNAAALFERASAYDSTGHPDRAVPLYRQALEHGLHGIRRRRATIQMASSLRNLGKPEQAVELLRVERERGSTNSTMRWRRFTLSRSPTSDANVKRFRSRSQHLRRIYRVISAP